LNYVRIPRVKFDASGNLWVVNTNAEKVVKILKKDGTWVSLNYSDIANFPTMVDLIIDARGWLWVTSYQGVPGIFCAKMNNTPFDTADDRTKLVINTFTNKDDTDYTIDQVYCITEDKNGEIWVGTNNGLFVIDDADKFFNDGTFTQIKVSRNDGSGLADYLFASAPISALQVDGANRKWVGTKNNGIYLVSADGQETLHHFTKDNSVLPSNEITSIAIHKTRGEVFIGTSEGIVSYMSDATEPELTLQESAVHAYPNPVKSSYNGVISIIGLTHGCEIKIVDMAGYLITEGTSVGGQFTWNGRNASGEKVSSGIYYVLMYDANGDESLATKILITR
jgi:ligand-binding sensor domain-containing protein